MFFTTVARVDFSGLALHTRRNVLVSKRSKRDDVGPHLGVAAQKLWL
jgi:hypothetical protein